MLHAVLALIAGLLLVAMLAQMTFITMDAPPPEGGPNMRAPQRPQPAGPSMHRR